MLLNHLLYSHYITIIITQEVMRRIARMEQTANTELVASNMNQLRDSVDKIKTELNVYRLV